MSEGQTDEQNCYITCTKQTNERMIKCILTHEKSSSMRWYFTWWESVPFLYWCLTSQSTAMVMSGRSVHLTAFFPWASLTKLFTSTSCTYVRLLLTQTLLESTQGRKRRINQFMINLHKSMGLGCVRTRDPWTCSQTRVYSQTRPANSHITLQ